MKINKKFIKFIYFFLFTFFILNFSNQTEANSDINIYKKIKVYSSADEAKNRKNYIKYYEPGLYYIYREYDGMYNISHTKSTPGAWINPNDNIGNKVSGYLKYDTNVRSSINGTLIDLYKTGKYVSGFEVGNWIKLDNGYYIYNFGLDKGTPIHGYLKYNTNVRKTKNGTIIDLYSKGTYISGVKDGNWIKLNNGYYIYNLGLNNATPIYGYLKYDTNVRKTKNGTIIDLYSKGTYISGVKDGNWIKLDNGYYIYNLGLNNATPIYGYLKYDTNVRKTKNGTIIDLYSKGTYISGIKDGNWIKLDNGYYLYNLGLTSINFDAGKNVSGYLILDTNVRNYPIDGKIIDTYSKGTYVSGIESNGWIKVENGHYIYNFGLENPIQISGFLKLDTNVRKSKNGEIVDLYLKDTFVSGIIDGNWIKLENGKYIYNFGLSYGPEVSGYISESVNVRTFEINGDIVDVLPAGTFIKGHKKDNWIKLDENRYIYDFGLYTLNELKLDFPALYATVINPKHFIITLDPGHGGGVAHNRGGLLFNEGDQNYKFSKLIEQEANKYANVTVINTRSNINENPDFTDRASAGNGADLFVSLHTNAAGATVRGTETWASNKNQNTSFAVELNSEFAKLLNTNNRGVKYDTTHGIYSTPQINSKDTWYVFKENEADIKLLIETAFHTNLEDSRAYLENQEELAAKFMKIVAKHFNLKLK